MEPQEILTFYMLEFHRSLVSAAILATHGTLGVLSHIHVISRIFKDTQSMSEHAKNSNKGNSISYGGHLSPMPRFPL